MSAFPWDSLPVSVSSFSNVFSPLISGFVPDASPNTTSVCWSLYVNFTFFGLKPFTKPLEAFTSSTSYSPSGNSSTVASPFSFVTALYTLPSVKEVTVNSLPANV